MRIALKQTPKRCEGSGSAPAERRKYQGITGDWLGKCGECGAILKPKKDGTLRSHSERGRNTRSHDKTMEILWEHAKTEEQLNQHFAIGLRVYIREGATPAGFEGPFGDGSHGVYWDRSDYLKPHVIEAVETYDDDKGDTFVVAGWEWHGRDLTVA